MNSWDMPKEFEKHLTTKNYAGEDWRRVQTKREAQKNGEDGWMKFNVKKVQIEWLGLSQKSQKLYISLVKDLEIVSF